MWEPPWSLLAALGPLLAVALVSLRLAGRLLPAPAPLPRLAAAAILSLGIWTLVPLVLGVLGLLAPAPFRATLALLAVAAGALRPGSPLRLPAVSADRELGMLTALALLLAAAIIGFAWRHAGTPAGDIAYDDASYHLPAVMVWVHHGDLRMPKLPIGDPSTPYYPIGGELLSWGLLALLRDNDFLARWAQLVPMLLSLPLAAAIARELGVSRRGALVAALLPLAAPRVMALGFTAGNDHSLSFATLAAIWAGLRLARGPSAGTAVLLGFGLGLAAGAKYLGLLYLPPLAVVALLALLARRSRASEIAAVVAVAAAIALVVGGFTYLRNLVATGNPLFPTPVRLVGFTLWEGWESVTLAARRRAPEGSLHAWAFFWQRRDLFGAVVPWLLVPAALLAPFAGLRRSGGRGRRWLEVAVLALPVVYYLIFVHLVHDHRDLRYFLAGLTLAAVGAVVAVERWSPPAVRARLRPAILFAAVAGLLAAGPFAVPVALAVTAGAAVAGLASGAAVLSRLARAPAAARAALAAAALVAVLVAGGRAAAAYPAHKLANQPAVAALERLTGTEGAVVAYCGWNVPYPFTGSRLQNRVELVPRRLPVEGRFYDRETGPWDPYLPTARARLQWLTALDELGVELVVVDGRGEPPEARWMRREAERFTPLHIEPQLEIWRLLRETR